MVVLNNVGKVYSKKGGPTVQALESVSLEIKEGSFTAITGPSGSGKSTLMNIIGLLDRPSQGNYILDSREVSSLNDDGLAGLRNRKIGFVFQAFHLLPRTTAKENVELPLIYANPTKSAKQAVQVLDAVGLAERMNHYPNEMSGGEQQRVAIARALINDPEIILADEPTGNLDPHAGEEIMKIFQNLHQEGRTIILITHDRKIAGYAQWIVHLAGGRVLDHEKAN